jgi:hypothetical protein
MTHRRTLVAAAAALALLLPAPAPFGGAGAASAQAPAVRPFLPWRTLRTAHFDVHYPAQMEQWATAFAARLEPVHERVAALVGSAPRRRVTVVVEDPSSASNGYAFSFPAAPTLVIWPTPPDPRSQLGNNRGPAEQLAVHEFAHLAHLTRPSREPGERRLERLLPFRLGPVARKAPRWVTEGYATWVEGRITGSGRPHSVIRAAILRQWALEGKLPTYGQMSASSAFQGGSMAYLAGSAFLEWLVAQRGEQSLVDLWRRMSARVDRSFDEAFAGVYGGYPQDLYGRFTVEVTARSLQARDLLARAGLEDGTPVQTLSWQTGDPAVSPDGKALAIVLRGAPGTPSRVVVWSTAPTPDSVYQRSRGELVRRDPQDVPPVEWRPCPLRTLAVLPPVHGRGHDMPRFLPGGEEILVVRWEPTGDADTRPDLFVWSWRKGGLRRVTRGASVRTPDPFPDGRSAAAVRCRAGICDLVRVDLATGRLRVLAMGSPDTVWYRPRVSPDGRTVAAAVQHAGLWRVALVDAATGAVRYAAPEDGASRYDAAWLPGGRGLVLVSEAGGVANLAALDTATGTERGLTRVTGAALAPEPDPATGAVYFLSLHAKGLDLNRVHPDSAATGTVVALPPSLAPAAPPERAVADTLPRAPLPPSRPYGAGPRRSRWLPAGGASADGISAGVLLSSQDPVGRLSLMARAVYGFGAAPGGAALDAVWRGWRPAVGGEAFFLHHDPSENALDVQGLNARYGGAELWLEHAWTGGPGPRTLRVGVSAGALDLTGEREPGDTVNVDDGDDGARLLAYAGLGFSAARSRGGTWVSAALRLGGAAGSTGDDAWQRGVAALTLAVSGGPVWLRGDALYGRVNDGAPAWERFAVGGPEPGPVDPALLSQRIPMPGLPFGIVRGREVLVLKASTRLGGLTPFYWAASGGGLEDWRRAVGVEVGEELPASALLGIPGARLSAGVAYSLDEPFRDRLRGWAGVSYRP